jgi:predicted metal-dependent hydrolase
MVSRHAAALTEGICLFNRGEFFACHEVWEDEWRDARRPRRLFLQALIHIAVAFHHRQQGNPAGEERQMRKGLKKLAAYLPEYEGIDTGALYHSCAAGLPEGASFPRITVRG